MLGIERAIGLYLSRLCGDMHSVLHSILLAVRHLLTRLRTHIMHSLYPLVRRQRCVTLITVALLTSVFWGCGQDQLPVDDLCTADAPNQCVPCTTDEDCVIGGDPCCHPQFRYYCGHVDLIEHIEECTISCVAETPLPDNTRCQCIEGQCHSG